MSAPIQPEDDVLRVFPVGHFFGVRDAGTRFEVRVGPLLHRLDAPGFAVWALSHGLPDAVGAWTVEQVVATAAEAGTAGAAEAMDRLQADGLVVTAAPVGPTAHDLARRVRLVPQLLGLGNSAEAPHTWSMGFPDRPVVSMDATLYDVVSWAHMDTSLWRACEGSSAVARRSGVADEVATDAELTLAALLRSLHPLLSSGAVRLDTWQVQP